MAKRRRNNNASGAEILAAFFSLCILIISLMIQAIIYILSVFYIAITIYTSGYKAKSQNGFFKTYFNKGNYGEFKLYKKAIKLFGKPHVLTNLYLESENTEFTELDVVAVTKKGIYVFEMKNYGGYIYGSSKDEFWTQAFHKNSKNKFYNPLRQNYAHTKAIEKYLNVDSTLIKPLIIFGNSAKLAKLNVHEKQIIINMRDLKKYYKNTIKNEEDNLTDQQVIEFLDKLMDKTHMSEEVKLKHIEDTKQLAIINNK